MSDTHTPAPGSSAPVGSTRRTLLGSAGLGLLATVTAAVAPRIGAWAGSPAATSGNWGVGADNPGTTPGWGSTTTPTAPRPPEFSDVINRVVGMPDDWELRQRARRFGLDIVNLTWEDTGRYLGSSVGPNISDLTLQVREPLGRGQGRTHLLPVLRYPNFSDTTGDVRLDKVWVRVGNQHARARVVAVPLSELLGNLRAYLADPSSLGGSGNFLSPRDTHVLTSAQHVFMPLPKSGRAEFNPVLYNYQSSPGNPAVLSLLVTRQGTSATIIENWTGDQSWQTWGQQLYFNNKGQRTVFTAERRSAVKARIEEGRTRSQDEGALEEGSDMVMVIQVPLLHREETVMFAPPAPAVPEAGLMPPTAKAAAPTSADSAGAQRRERSDVEQAVIGFGKDQGPFREMAGRRLERDTRFPIRVTVQFYKATSNGVVSDADLSSMKAEIDRVYGNADFVGSLVVPSGDRPRPTEWAQARTPW